MGELMQLRGRRWRELERKQKPTPPRSFAFVDLILYQAIQDRASDIHFEPFENEFKIRYRVDGALYEMAPPPRHLALPVISRVKVMASMNIAERRLPQDGRIQKISPVAMWTCASRRCPRSSARALFCACSIAAP